MEIYYLKLTPIRDGNSLISPKEVLKEYGVKFTSFIIDEITGPWIYECDGKDIFNVIESTWKDCLLISQIDALTLLPNFIVRNEKLVSKDTIKQELIDIDIASIRSLREWLSTKEDCPEFLKIHEQNAQNIRSLIK